MKKILNHTLFQQIIFWGISFFVLHRLFTREGDNGLTDIYFTILFHFPLLLIVYGNYFLVNQFFIKKRKLVFYIFGILELIGVAVGFHYLTFNLLADWIFPGYYFVSFYEIREVLEFVVSYAIISILLFLSKNWFALKEKQLALEKEQLLKNIKNPPLVIFTTAYSEYAVEAFELEALDYLVKPIAFDRFLKAMNNAKKRLKEQKGGKEVAKLFTIKENKRIYKVDFEAIFLLQAYGDYVRIYTQEKKYVTKSKLNLVKIELPNHFLQIHRSYIINLNHLKYMEGNMVQVSTEKVPVSLSFREALLNRL